MIWGFPASVLAKRLRATQVGAVNWQVTGVAFERYLNYAADAIGTER
jgi:hypothetical protein